MRGVPLTDKQRKAMMPYQRSVGELYRTLDRLRDAILNENREEFSIALKSLRDQLPELRALVSPTLGSEPTCNSESSRSSPDSALLGAAPKDQAGNALEFGTKDDESREKLRNQPPASPRVQ